MASEATNMNAVVYAEYGGVDKMELKAVPKPQPGPREVLIKVTAAAVNPVDWKLREGYIKAWPQTLPIIPGWDVSGVVESVGAEVKSFAAGDEVWSYTRPASDLKIDGEPTEHEQIGFNGTIAEYVTVAHWKVARKPASINMSQAAAVPLAGLTAWQGLFDQGGVQAGSKVVILGASGGVGSFAVQFAKARGATVIGTCSTRNVEFVQGLGADHVIDYSKGDVAAAVRAIEANGVDMVYDCVGGPADASVGSVRDGGIVISIANFTIPQDCAAAGRNITGKSFVVAPSSSQLGEIGALMDAGKVRVSHLEEIPVAEFKRAFEASQSGRTRGKLVLTF